MTPSVPDSDSADLAALQERLALVLRATNDGIWDWNLLTDEVYFSARWKEMLGYAEQEIAPDVEEWRRRVHPDDLARALATIDAHLAGETATYELEHRLRHKDGSYRWIIARGVSVRDPAGRVVRLVGSHTDITERRLAEEALREREAQYRSVWESTGDGLVITDLDTEDLLDVNPAFCAMHGYTREELLVAHPSLFIHPDSIPLFREYIAEVSAGREYHCRAVDVRKDGSVLHVEVHGTSFLYRGRRCVLGVVRDITDRVTAFQVLERRVAERTRELSALLEVSRTVTSTLDLPSLLGLILDQIKAAVDYTGAAILTVEDEQLVVREARGEAARDPAARGARFPLPAGTAHAEAFRRRQPVIVTDVRDATAFARAYREAVGEWAGSPSFSYVRSWMAVPLVLNEQVTGILSLSHAEPGFYTERHAQLAGAIADQAAIAIENARLYAQAQGVAALEERQRLARDLHDSVAQSLFSMSMIAGALPALAERKPALARERLARLSELAHGALAEMRALLFELRPESLEREGLVAALEKQTAALRARHGLSIELTLSPEPSLSLEAKEALYRIAQEALHNTVKHAQAAHARVTLSVSADLVRLEIEDDGVGFEPGAVPAGRLGQQSMRERAERAGGSIDVRSAPGQGTAVRVTLPLTR